MEWEKSAVGQEVRMGEQTVCSLTTQVLRFFFEFWSDFLVCFPLRPLDMRSKKKISCRYRKYDF